MVSKVNVVLCRVYVSNAGTSPSRITGGSHGGEGGLGQGQTRRNSVYGSHLEPVQLGSGVNVHGGGAIEVATKKLTIDGRVSAK